ncbi:MAG: hypothetical protein K6F87_00955 [Lachnospiraceae bacterium]|nr:hypothetical protein [Lachnospiraceae bacterium]
MTFKRKVIVNILATVAFIFLFLLPVLAFLATTTQAGSTEETAMMHTGDYIFFVVDDSSDVPLAAAPTTNVSSYVLWVGLASFAIMIMFIYSAWYMSVRKNLRELSFKLSPVERKAFSISQGYLHPIRSYQLAKEAEDSVASLYVNYI